MFCCVHAVQLVHYTPLKIQVYITAIAFHELKYLIFQIAWLTEIRNVNGGVEIPTCVDEKTASPRPNTLMSDLVY